MAKIVCNISRYCLNNHRALYQTCKSQVSVSPQILVNHDFSRTRFYQYSSEKKTPVEPVKKLTLMQRFKQMYRDYWYVLVPVHVITSAGWFGGFYYLAKSGVDIVAILENLHLSEKLTNPLKDSSMGYLAISYALYKIATPVRYTVTIGGTTISINYLKEWGYIKPVPSATQLKEMYKERKENILDSFHDKSKNVKDIKDSTLEKLKPTKDVEVPKKMR